MDIELTGDEYEIFQDGNLWKARDERRIVAVAESWEDLFVKINIHATKENYFPGIVEINDHSNITWFDYEGNVRV